MVNEMVDHEAAMLNYVKLAALSHQKQQLLGRDKLLILAGVAACNSGWLEVAERCRELVLSSNQSHLIGKSESFADALRDSDFPPFIKQLERICSYEKAEHLVKELTANSAGNSEHESMSKGDYALQLLMS